MTGDARYDEIASWYVEWVGAGDGFILDGATGLAPRSVKGARVLDVACGHGRSARGLARRGALVVGVDLAAELISIARGHEVSDHLGIEYRVADISEPDAWWDGVPFDGAVCEMAMMDIDDLAGAVNAVAMTVRPAGWFLISMVHPCFPGNEAGLSSWPPGRSYFDEGRWTSTDHNPEGVRIRVGSWHRTIATYINTVIDAGFSIEGVVESVASVPIMLLLRCRRAT